MTIAAAMPIQRLRRLSFTVHDGMPAILILRKGVSMKYAEPLHPYPPSVSRVVTSSLLRSPLGPLYTFKYCRVDRLQYILPIQYMSGWVLFHSTRN